MIGDYLRMAAAQLRRAAVARKDETANLRREMSQREQDVHRMIDDLKRVIDSRQRQIGAIDNAAIKAERAAEITKLNNEIKVLQSDFDREKQRINQELQWKEGQVDDLNSQAVNFERQASTMGQ